MRLETRISLMLFVAAMVTAGSVRSQADRARILAVTDLEDDGAGLGADEMLFLTENVYAAATSFGPRAFSVISRDRLERVIEANTSGSRPGLTRDEIGAMLGAELVFEGGVSIEKDGSLSATLKLAEVPSGRLLGLDHVVAGSARELGEMLELSASDILGRALPEERVAEEEAGPPLIPLRPPRDDRPETCEVRFEARPAEATIYMDGDRICRGTPCTRRVPFGNHEFRAEAEVHRPDTMEVEILGETTVEFELEERYYSYFGMHDLEGGGWLVSGGLSPIDPGYKNINALDGVHFARLHPVVDIGFGGGVFGYRETPRGASWSILGFGPAVRFGRLIVSSQIQMLSFRHESRDHGTGWLPGISVYARLPLVNTREAKGWSFLVPTPTVGYDTWFHDLNHDHSAFWIGLSWPGTVHF